MRWNGMSVVLAVAMSVSGSQARADEPSAESTYAEIKRTLGLVPSFMKAYPEAGIAAAWDEWRTIELDPKTAIPNKTKELIGLAVASQIPCRYCVYFHTQAAKLNGASDREIKEAIAAAALTRHWSTVLNGLQLDDKQFERELQNLFAFLAKPHKPHPAIQVVDAASAYKDMEQMFGSVPSFMKKFPERGIAAAWRQLKVMQFATDSALPAKTKDLIGLAVSAQIPCKFCVAFDTKSSKLDGASDVELAEAVAMAAITRHWSTVLNGSLIDEAQFRREVDEVIRNSRNVTGRAGRP